MTLDNSLKITYHDGSINIVDESTKKAVGRAVEKVQNRYDSKLLQNVNIHVASDFSNLKGDTPLISYFRKHQKSLAPVAGVVHLGCIDNIFIQESGFVVYKTKNLFANGNFSADNQIEQATMHELGHRFDELFGNQNKTLAKKVESIVKKMLVSKNLTENDEKIIEDFEQQNGYSDTKEYMQALQKDLAKINIFKGDTYNKYRYFINEFFKESNGYSPTLEHIQTSYFCRAEIFAQLFSYLNGTDDGKKEDFLKTFSNTAEIVKQYMENHTK